MKRDGYIIEEIVTEENMGESFDYVMRGRKRKTSRTGRRIIRNREKVLEKLTESIKDGTFRIAGYREMTINERGKTRRIQVIRLEERIAVNAIVRVMEKHLHRRFITDTAASIKGRGTHYLLRRIVDAMRKHPECRKVYKFDIRKCYESVCQDIMMEAVRRVFKDRKLIRIVGGLVRMTPSGVSIGLRSSQPLVNLLLSVYLDHVIKDRMGVKLYRRYCDDGLVRAENYRALTDIARTVHARLAEAGLSVNGNEQMWSLDDRDIDFLGYRIYGDGKIGIRKHIKQRFARRWKRVKSRKRKVQLAASFYGIAKHAHARHLFKKLTGTGMKDFADFGLVYKAPDGKKRWDCDKVALGDLVNTTIVVEDFERNIKTREGEGRYLVKFTSERYKDGAKFFTNSDELKQMLDLIDGMADGFPFRTTIVRKPIGNGNYKYCFS